MNKKLVTVSIGVGAYVLAKSCLLIGRAQGRGDILGMFSTDKNSDVKNAVRDFMEVSKDIFNDEKEKKSRRILHGYTMYYAKKTNGAIEEARYKKGEKR